MRPSQDDMVLDLEKTLSDHGIKNDVSKE